WSLAVIQWTGCAVRLRLRLITDATLCRCCLKAPTSATGQLTGKLAALKEYNGLPIPEGYFPQAMERLRNKFLNVPVDAVLHPASDFAQQAATEQKDKAASAQEEALRQLSPEEPRKQAAAWLMAPGRWRKVAMSATALLVLWIGLYQIGVPVWV